MSPKALLRSAILFVSLAALGVLLKMSGLAQSLDESWIDAHIRGRGVAGPLVFVAAGAVFTSIGLPRQVVSFLAGYAFGFVPGTGLALVATALGCATTFSFARLVGREAVARRLPSKIRRIDDFLHDNPFSMTLLIRFLPLGSNFLTSLTAGVSSVSAAAFITGSAIGFVPQTVVFALVGSGVNLDTGFRFAVGAALFALSGALGVYLYRKHRHGKSFDDALERDLTPAVGEPGGETPRAGDG